MLAKMTRNEPIAAEPSGEFARLHKLLAPPKKPPALLLAERGLTKVREDRAAIAERYRAAVQRDYAAGVSRLSGEAIQLAGELAEHDKRIKQAKAELDLQRDSLGQIFLQEVGPGCDAAKETINDLLDKLDEVIGPFINLHKFLEHNQLARPDLLSKVPYLRASVREMRRLIGRQ